MIKYLNINKHETPLASQLSTCTSFKFTGGCIVQSSVITGKTLKKCKFCEQKKYFQEFAIHKPCIKKKLVLFFRTSYHNTFKDASTDQS